MSSIKQTTRAHSQLQCENVENVVEGSDGATQDIFQPSMRIRSEVWQYSGFDKSAEGKLTEDEYSVCRKNVTANSGNTSNLHSHLRDHHPQLQSAQCLMWELCSGGNRHGSSVQLAICRSVM